MTHRHHGDSNNLNFHISFKKKEGTERLKTNGYGITKFQQIFWERWNNSQSSILCTKIIELDTKEQFDISTEMFVGMPRKINRAFIVRILSLDRFVCLFKKKRDSNSNQQVSFIVSRIYTRRPSERHIKDSVCWFCKH